jgi:hypothetical protein
LVHPQLPLLAGGHALPNRIDRALGLSYPGRWQASAHEIVGIPVGIELVDKKKQRALSIRYYFSREPPLGTKAIFAIV